MKPAAEVSSAYTNQSYVLTPGLWEQLPHSGSLQLCEEGTAVHTTEVTNISMPVKLFCHYCEPRGLLQIESSGRYKIPGSEEVAHLRTDIPVHLLYHLINIALYISLS